jgi:hypothetical protein
MINPKNDLSGHIFGHLTVLSRHGMTHDNRATWNCKCSCGVRKVMVGKYLTSGKSISCGCVSRREVVNTSR